MSTCVHTIGSFQPCQRCGLPFCGDCPSSTKSLESLVAGSETEVKNLATIGLCPPCVSVLESIIKLVHESAHTADPTKAAHALALLVAMKNVQGEGAKIRSATRTAAAALMGVPLTAISAVGGVLGGMVGGAVTGLAGGAIYGGAAGLDARNSVGSAVENTHKALTDAARATPSMMQRLGDRMEKAAASASANIKGMVGSSNGVGSCAPAITDAAHESSGGAASAGSADDTGGLTSVTGALVLVGDGLNDGTASASGASSAEEAAGGSGDPYYPTGANIGMKERVRPKSSQPTASTAAAEGTKVATPGAASASITGTSDGGAAPAAAAETSSSPTDDASPAAASSGAGSASASLSAEQEVNRIAKCKNAYEILELDASTATDEEIRAAYKRKSRLYHPDRHTAGSQEQAFASKAFQAINSANAILSDPAKRRAYDSSKFSDTGGVNLFEGITVTKDGVVVSTVGAVVGGLGGLGVGMVGGIALGAASGVAKTVASLHDYSHTSQPACQTWLLAVAALQEEAIRQLDQSANASQTPQHRSSFSSAFDGSSGRSRAGSATAVSEALDRVKGALSGFFSSSSKRGSSITSAGATTALSSSSAEAAIGPIGLLGAAVKEVEAFEGGAGSGGDEAHGTKKEIEVSYGYGKAGGSATTATPDLRELLSLLSRGGANPLFYRAKFGGARPGAPEGAGADEEDDDSSLPYADDDDSAPSPLVLSMETLFDASNAFVVNEELLTLLKEAVLAPAPAAAAVETDLRRQYEALWVGKLAEAAHKASKSLRFLSGIPEPKSATTPTGAGAGGASAASDTSHHDSVHHGDDDIHSERLPGMPPLHTKVTAENAPKSALGMLELMATEVKESVKDVEALHALERGMALMKAYAQRARLAAPPANAVKAALALSTAGSSSAAAAENIDGAWGLFLSALAAAVKGDVLHAAAVERDAAMRKKVTDRAAAAAASVLAASLAAAEGATTPASRQQAQKKAEQQAQQAYEEVIRRLPPPLQPAVLPLNQAAQGRRAGSGFVPAASPLSLLCPLLVMPAPVAVSVLVGAVSLSNPALQAVITKPESLVKAWKKALKTEGGDMPATAADVSTLASALVATPYNATPLIAVGPSSGGNAGGAPVAVVGGAGTGNARWQIRSGGSWRTSAVPLALTCPAATTLAIDDSSVPFAASPAFAVAAASSSSSQLPPALGSVYQQIKWRESATLPLRNESFVVPSSLVEEALLEAKRTSSSAAEQEAFRLFVLLRPVGPNITKPSERELLASLFSTSSSPYQTSPLAMFHPPALWREVMASADVDVAFTTTEGGAAVAALASSMEGAI